jgi:hypothetical protein
MTEIRKEVRYTSDDDWLLYKSNNMHGKFRMTIVIKNTNHFQFIGSDIMLRARSA